MWKFIYNVFVGGAYVLGLSFFLIWNILQKICVPLVLILGLFLFHICTKKQT